MWQVSEDEVVLLEKELRARASSVRPLLAQREREFFIGNLLVRIHFTIVVMRWTGLAQTPRAPAPPALERSNGSGVQGYLAHKKQPPPLGTP